MNPNNEIITDLPGRQTKIILDEDLGGAKKTKRNWEGGLIGLRIIADGDLQLTYLYDDAPGPVFPVSAGDVVVARIRQVNSGTTIASTDLIGLV